MEKKYLFEHTHAEELAKLLEDNNFEIERFEVLGNCDDSCLTFTVRKIINRS